MNDILFLSIDIINRIQDYCTENLLLHTWGLFQKHSPIVFKKDGELPSRFWCVTDFISSDDNSEIMNKMNVILSFIQCKGIVEIDSVQYIDISNLISIVRKKGLIDDEQLAQLSDPWFDLNYKGVIPNFDII